MKATISFIPKNNDAILELNKVKDRKTGSYINDATVTAYVYDQDGTEIVGDIVCSYIASSSGRYVGILDAGESVVWGEYYDVKWVGTATGDIEFEIWSRRLLCEYNEA